MLSSVFLSWRGGVNVIWRENGGEEEGSVVVVGGGALLASL